IGTILSLIGVRINNKKNLWVKELELIPLDELGRPRIDVVVTICGIFRDTFGITIELLNRAFEMAALTDEDPDMNFVRKHYLEKRDDYGDMAMARIAGPASTEYATSMRTLIESGDWENEEELTESYEDSMNHIYFRGRIEKRKELFSYMLSNVDIITQERDNTEYEITDLDHYYEFLGGLSRTVKGKRGEVSKVMIVDSTEEELIVEDINYSIERASRTRIFNPKWIAGMLKHDFHGAKKIKDRVENLLGLAATTGAVKNWIFDSVADRYIFDEEIFEQLKKNNPYAAVKIGELLIETERRGYWKTDEDKLEHLKNIILRTEADIE
ncbi:MAG: cobaltochelatase subunit CobN, partial [Actinomycetia bacterium]|nr:cobaltochelatase subunit CobN [Actinomycetes bacterium]